MVNVPKFLKELAALCRDHNLYLEVDIEDNEPILFLSTVIENGRQVIAADYITFKDGAGYTAKTIFEGEGNDE